MTSANSTGAHVDSRTLLGRSLVGDGIEIGPGHRPFPLAFGGATARYLDQWDSETNRLLFPEVEQAVFARPDVLANLDIERHRKRSIHVHCWTEAEFAEVVVYTIVELGLAWELMDRLDVDDSPDGMEFGLVLRRPTVCLPGAEGGERFWRVWHALHDRLAPASPSASLSPAPDSPSTPTSPDAVLIPALRIARRLQRLAGGRDRTHDGSGGTSTTLSRPGER